MKKKLPIFYIGLITLSLFLASCKRGDSANQPLKNAQETKSNSEIEKLKAFLETITPAKASEFTFHEADSGFYYKDVFQIDLEHLRVVYEQSKTRRR